MNTFTVIYEYLINNNLVTNLKDLSNKSGYDYIYLSKLKNAKNDVSFNFVEKINSIFNTKFDFESVSKRSGGYRNNDSHTTILRHSKGQPGILFYDLDFLGGNGVVFDGGDRRPDYILDIPEFNGCTAFRIYGDSMEPRIKSGSMVFAKKIDNWKEVIEYGQIYGIVYDDGRRWCKKIRKSDKKDCLLLQSENSDHDDFEVKKDRVKSIWLIHGWIVKKV